MVEEAAVLASEVQPLSLYFDLVPGSKADLEVAGRAAVCFAQALKEAAAQLSPGLEIRVEIISGTEGSLSLNTIIKAAKDTVKLDAKTLRYLSYAALAWFGTHVADWTFDKVADSMLEHATAEEHVKPPLTPQEIGELAQELNRLQASSAVQQKVEQVYRTLEQDKAISGVGVNLASKPTRPNHVVPSEQFRARARLAQQQEQATKHRTRDLHESVKIISAVLDPESKRRWVIASSEGQFSARMEDKQFQHRLNAGLISSPLSNHINLLATLRFVEVSHNGNWQVQNVSIIKVDRIILPKAAEDLTSAPMPPDTQDREPNGSDNG